MNLLILSIIVRIPKALPGVCTRCFLLKWSKLIIGSVRIVLAVRFTRVMVPLESREGLRSRISEHYGRAPYFAVIDLSGGDVRVDFIENPRSQGYTPGEYAVVSGVEYVVIKGDIGVRALRLLRGRGIKVVETSGKILGDVIEELKSGGLREYVGEGCPGQRR